MAYMTDTVREDESNIIAFVNLDEGVISGDRAVNYAASLIHFPAAIMYTQVWNMPGMECRREIMWLISLYRQAFLQISKV